MKKILVTTDFSNASKAGMRFAIQLATQIEAELVFFHCFRALIPTTIYQERINQAVHEQTANHLHDLERLVNSLYKSLEVEPGIHQCVVVEDLSIESTILDYARQNGFQYICMSTRGAGSIQKMLGTHTGSVLQQSQVPVLVVPHTYHVRPIKKLLYASDLENFEQEMNTVDALAEDLQVKTDLLHFYYPGSIPLDRETLAEMWRAKHPQLDEVYFSPYNLDESFAAQLDHATKKIHPSLVVFFTHPKKKWFDKVFGPSVSESVSFVTTLPMLVCRK